MSAISPGKVGGFVAAVGRFLINFLTNMVRRLLIFGHYILICWQQQRLRRAWRQLGQRLHLSLEEGEVNPMLTEPVKDAVDKARQLKAGKDRQYQAIAEIREKMRAGHVAKPAAPPPEASGPQEPPKGRDQTDVSKE
ncbi:MAG: hypothetical protein QME75_14290 [Deltaproteobacteria bacterium]|nr:hypothetical protein [Deltaproteobacteria bacterium]